MMNTNQKCNIKIEYTIIIMQMKEVILTMQKLNNNKN